MIPVAQAIFHKPCEDWIKRKVVLWRGTQGLSKLTAIMATNGDMPSDEESGPDSPSMVAADQDNDEIEETAPLDQPRSALKISEPLPEIKRPELPEQPDPENLDISSLTPLSPEIIARQATINIGTIGHVAHGKSTVVKAISGVQTVRFKNELERNITIKLGYANAVRLFGLIIIPIRLNPGVARHASSLSAIFEWQY